MLLHIHSINTENINLVSIANELVRGRDGQLGVRKVIWEHDTWHS